LNEQKFVVVFEQFDVKFLPPILRLIWLKSVLL